MASAPSVPLRREMITRRARSRARAAIVRAVVLAWPRSLARNNSAVLARLLGSPAWARAFSLSGAFVGFAPALELACVDELGELDDRLDGTHRLSKPHGSYPHIVITCSDYIVITE